MEGEEHDKEHNGKVFVTDVLKESTNEGKSVHLEFGNKLLVPEGYLLCNERNSKPDIKLVGSVVGQVKSIVEENSHDFPIETRNGKVKSDKDNLTDSQDIVKGKFTLDTFSSITCSEKKIVLESLNEDESTPLLVSTHLGCEGPQDESAGVYSNGSLCYDRRIAIGQLSSREVISFEKIQFDSIDHLQTDVLLSQPDTGFGKDGTYSEEPKATDTVNLPHAVLCNDHCKKALSSSNNGGKVDLKLEDIVENSDTGCQDHENSCQTVFSCEQSLLKKEQDMDVFEKDTSQVMHNQTGRTDSLILCNASKVPPNGSAYLETAIEKCSRINGDLSSLAAHTQLGSLTLQPASSDTDDASDKGIVTHTSFQCADNNGESKDPYSPVNIRSFSLFQNKTTEFGEVRLLFNDDSKSGGNANKESNIDVDLSNQKSLNTPVISTELRDVDTVNNEDNSNEGKYLTIQLSKNECSGNVSRDIDSLSKTLNTEHPGKKEPSGLNVIDIHKELCYEDDGSDKSASVVAGRKNGDGKYEEGESSDRDEGELSDDDVEEGEIKEPGSKKPLVRSACPFFQKGACASGISCRFLHPGVNDKGNYQMIEVSRFPSPTSRATQLSAASLWTKLSDEPRNPLAKAPEVPSTETAWERGLRLAKEQKKKVMEIKEQDPCFENKGLDKESDPRMSKLISRVPFYDQPSYEEDMYYKSPGELLESPHYEGFQGRHHQNSSYAQSYRDSPLGIPSSQYVNPYSPLEKFERNGFDQRQQFRSGASPFSRGYTPPPMKRADEWIDPWRRSKSPQHRKDNKQSLSRGRQKHRSKSDFSHSSRSSSGSSSSSSRSSQSFTSSSRSSRERSRSNVSRRGSGSYDSGYHKSGSSLSYQQGSYRGGSYGGPSVGPGIVYVGRNMKGNGRGRIRRQNGRSTPDRPLPYVRPKRRSGSSYSDSSSSSRSRSRRRKSSQGSSRSRSSSKSLKSPPKNDSGSTAAKINQATTTKCQQAATDNHLDTLPYPPFSLDQIPHPSDPKPPLPDPPTLGKLEPATPKAPQATLKTKDSLKLVGQKSGVKLTITPKQPVLDTRPNILDSPPVKRQLSDEEDDEVIVVSALPPTKVNPPTIPSTVKRLKSEKSRNVKAKEGKVKTLPSVPHPASSSLPPGTTIKQQSSDAKSQNMTQKPVKATVTAVKAKSKKNLPINRKELLKQLKAVEEAIAKKKSQLH